MTEIKMELGKDVMGCSIDFFVACQKSLKKSYGDRCVEPEKIQEIVDLLAKVEQIYIGLDKIGD